MPGRAAEVSEDAWVTSTPAQLCLLPPVPLFVCLFPEWSKPEVHWKVDLFKLH